MPNLSQTQINALIAIREIGDERTRKRRKAALFSEIKSQMRIPSSTKLRVEIDNTYASDYGALKDASTGRLLEPIAPTMGVRPTEALVAKPWQFESKVAAGTPARPPERARDVKPAFAGIENDVYVNGIARPAPSTPVLKLGSISLDDAASLLRLEGDTRESYSTTSEQVEAKVFVRGDRLYFVL